MVTNEKKMNVRAVELSNFEMETLRDARGTLNLLFGKVIAKDNMTHLAILLGELCDLIDALEENGNSLLEFEEEDK